MTFHQGDAQTTDRARTIAVFVLLAELLAAYWLPIPRWSDLASGLVAESLDPAVWITGKLPWPYPPTIVEELSGIGFSEPADESVPAQEGEITEDDSVDDSPAAGNAAGSDDIRILSHSPSVPQWVGDTAKFTVTVEYSLATAASGRIILSICSCKHTEYTPAPLDLGTSAEDLAHFSTVTDVAVNRGRGTEVITRTFRVPVADELILVAKLEGSSVESSKVDHRHIAINDAGRPPSGDKSSVRFLSIDPDPAKALRAGSDVEFWIAVEYNLIREFGVLRLWIEDGNAKPIDQFRENIRAGQRRLSFSGKVRTPSGDSPPIITVKAIVDETELREVVAGGSTRMELGPVGASQIESKTFHVTP